MFSVQNASWRAPVKKPGVALGTIYRYFSSKERLLLEAMVEQQEDLRLHLQAHPAPGETAVDRVVNVLNRANASLRRYPDVTAAMVRAFGASRSEDADIVERCGGDRPGNGRRPGRRGANAAFGPFFHPPCR